MADGKLRQIFRQHLPEFHWQAIESGFTGRGIPDANYCLNGIEGWVENKRTSGWVVNISPEQVGWHMRRARAGGVTFIAVRRQNITRVTGPVDQLWLYDGGDIEILRDVGIRAGPEPLVFTEGGPAKWNWKKISEALLKS